MDKLTKGETRLVIRAAAEMVVDCEKEADSARRWLAYAVDSDVEETYFKTVVAELETRDHIDGCDLSLWFEVPNTSEQRAILLERQDDVIAAAVNALASSLTGTAGF